MRAEGLEPFASGVRFQCPDQLDHARRCRAILLHEKKELHDKAEENSARALDQFPRRLVSSSRSSGTERDHSHEFRLSRDMTQTL